MTENDERFEKFLKNREAALKDLLLIVKDHNIREGLQSQLDTIEDIIHHFNVIVKGEISDGIGVKGNEAKLG